jgi:hypothetical protein
MLWVLLKLLLPQYFVEVVLVFLELLLLFMLVLIVLVCVCELDLQLGQAALTTWFQPQG